VGSPSAGSPLWLRFALAKEAHRSATRTAQPWYIVYAPPFAAGCRCTANAARYYFGMCSIKRALVCIFGCIALGAMQHETDVPTGPFIDNYIALIRGVIASRPTSISNSSDGDVLGFPVATQNTKPWLFRGERGWGGFQFKTALSFLYGSNGVEHLVKLTMKTPVQAYGARDCRGSNVEAVPA
jgi:hypothetical protein